MSTSNKNWFESVLWSSRLIVILAVVASLISAIGLFFMATIDAWSVLKEILHYAAVAGQPELRGEIRADVITHVVELVDGYLLATVMLIFGLGLYELFISEINLSESDTIANKVLIIDDLDDLKSRLAQVILMILIVRYFEFALNMTFNSALELLYFSIGIAFLGLALWLSNQADKGKSHK